MTGLIHIYCGDGKGKTTAALGLAVRCAGRKKPVLIARFMKTEDSGEVAVLKEIDKIQVLPCEKTFGFYYQMTDKQKEEAKQYYSDLLKLAFQKAQADSAQMLVLDEIMAVCQYELVDEQYLIELLKSRNPGMEVVLTGRNPSKQLLSMADYVSEIVKIKHPYEKGVLSREGIEY